MACRRASPPTRVLSHWVRRCGLPTLTDGTIRHIQRGVTAGRGNRRGHGRRFRRRGRGGADRDINEPARRPPRLDPRQGRPGGGVRVRRRRPGLGGRGRSRTRPPPSGGWTSWSTPYSAAGTTTTSTDESDDDWQLDLDVSLWARCAARVRRCLSDGRPVASRRDRQHRLGERTSNFGNHSTARPSGSDLAHRTMAVQVAPAVRVNSWPRARSRTPSWDGREARLDQLASLYPLAGSREPPTSRPGCHLPGLYGRRLITGINVPVEGGILPSNAAFTDTIGEALGRLGRVGRPWPELLAAVRGTGSGAAAARIPEGRWRAHHLAKRDHAVRATTWRSG